MCMEDVRLGRKSGGKVGTVSVATTATQIVPGDANRTSLMLGSHTTATITYSTDPAVSVNGGFVVGPGQPPIYLDIQRHGDIVRMGWFGIASVGPSSVGVAFSTLMEK